MSRQHQYSAEYLKLEEEIVDLIFGRVYPRHKLSQDAWDAIQKQIEEKQAKLKELLAKESA